MGPQSFQPHAVLASQIKPRPLPSDHATVRQFRKWPTDIKAFPAFRLLKKFSVCWQSRFHWRRATYNSLRLRTHQQSRVESNPVQSDSQGCGRSSVAYLQWQPLRCVHTSRVESSQVTRVLPSQESWCRMFYFHESDSSDRARRLLSWGINGCRKAYSLLENHEAIYDASRCEHRNRVLHWWYVHNNKNNSTTNNSNNVLIVIRPSI